MDVLLIAAIVLVLIGLLVAYTSSVHGTAVAGLLGVLAFHFVGATRKEDVLAMFVVLLLAAFAYVTPFRGGRPVVQSGPDATNT